MKADPVKTGSVPSPDHTAPCAHQDPQSIHRCLNRALATAGLDQAMPVEQPGLFSPHSVFATMQDIAAMRAVIEAIETVASHPDYVRAALERAPASATENPGNRGTFYGYDFHLTPTGPQLIEVNTNAGGLLLGVALLRAHLSCCPPLRERLPGHGDPDAIESGVVQMMRTEWQAAGRPGELQTIAIVDDAPEKQFLYPEFVLFQKLFERHGIRTLVVDAGTLDHRDHRLWAGDVVVDLVYNRLTDFSLELPPHASLASAYLAQDVVVTPHPHGYFRLADKRNLALLTDRAWLERIGVDAKVREVLLTGIASTRIVDPSHADQLWSERKKMFFKPVTGYGSKAVYRGDKLTRRVWDEILASAYVAQSLVPPSELPVEGLDEPVTLKSDVRHFVYNAQTQLVSARLYQGQTTNFRTPGGGFAPVFITRSV